MNVIHVLDQELGYGPSEDDVGLNICEDIILLENISKDRLLNLYDDFEAELRSEILHLFCMPNEEVLSRYGLLGIPREALEKSPKRAWGVAPLTLVQSKGLARLRNAPSIDALVTAGLWNGELGRQKMSGGQTLNGIVAGFDVEKQVLFLRTALRDTARLDDALRLTQYQALGLDDLRAKLSKTAPGIALEDLAISAHAELNKEAKEGTRKVFAPIMFAGYLATKGFWLLPLSMSSLAANAYPSWMRSIMLRMAIPTHHQPLAELILRSSVARTDGSKMIQMLPLVATSIAWSSTQWRPTQMRAGALIVYKAYYQQGLGSSADQRGWAANRIWDFQLEYFSLSPTDHPEAHFFVLHKRLAGKVRDLSIGFITPIDRIFARTNAFTREIPHPFQIG